jgi:hypothetical protein
MGNPLHELLHFGQLFAGLEQQLCVEISCPMIGIARKDVFVSQELTVTNTPHEHARDPLRL